MNKMMFLSAALIAAAAFTTQAMAAGKDVAARQNTAVQARKDCVRAPAVGAYATQPYTVPPCEPTADF